MPGQRSSEQHRPGHGVTVKQVMRGESPGAWFGRAVNRTRHMFYSSDAVAGGNVARCVGSFRGNTAARTDGSARRANARLPPTVRAATSSPFDGSKRPERASPEARILNGSQTTLTIDTHLTDGCSRPQRLTRARERKAEKQRGRGEPVQLQGEVTESCWLVRERFDQFEILPVIAVHGR